MHIRMRPSSAQGGVSCPGRLDAVEESVAGAVLAYTIRMFAQSGEPVAQRAILQLIEATVSLDPAITATPYNDSVGWAAYEVSALRVPAEEPDDLLRDLLPADASSSPVLLQLNTRPDTVKLQVDWGLRNGGPAAVASSDTLIELILSGYLTDWATVRSIRQTATRLWHAVLYDDGSGFAVSLDDLA